MSKLFQWIFVFAMVIVFLIYGLGKLSDSRTNQMYARAHLVEAKSDARLDFMGASMPYVVMILGTLGIGAAVVLTLVIIVAGAVAVMAITRHYDAIKAQGPPVMILQIQGGSPREVYKMLSNGPSTAKIINVKHK